MNSQHLGLLGGYEYNVPSQQNNKYQCGGFDIGFDSAIMDNVFGGSIHEEFIGGSSHKNNKTRQNKTRQQKKDNKRKTVKKTKHSIYHY